MGLKNRKQKEIRDASFDLASLRGEWEATINRLNLAQDYEATKRALTDTQIELDRVKEDHARENREIEHKLGLHKLQVEQERTSAVTEAKLAVREEALAAAQENHKEQINFIRERMENEMDAHRAILNEVLTRLPNFQHTRVEHVGVDPNPPQKLQIEQGS